MIRIQPAAFVFAAALVLLLPLDWLLAAFAAAVIHELGHLAAICLCGARLESITISGSGARIHTGPMDIRGEFLCAAAGPAASFLLLSVCRFFPKIALCGLIQGMFNLIPVYPMDGGRMLLCLIRRLCPRRAEWIFRLLQCLLFIVLLALSGIIALRRKEGFVPVLVAITVITRLVSGKIPCKSD